MRPTARVAFHGVPPRPPAPPHPQIVASGYHHKLPALLELLVARVAAFSVDGARFAVVKEALTREYANTLLGQPYQWAMNRAEVELRPGRVCALVV